MSGAWTSPHLTSVARLFARNIDLLNQIDTRFNLLRRSAEKVFHLMNRNSLNGSRKNISAHYDLSNEFFGTFLDDNMMYSAAIYPDSNCSLETASINKLDRVCTQLELSPEDHLLEIGTGWGGMAIHAAKNYGCKVTTTTISREQHAYAEKRIREEGLEDRVTLLLEDYRDLAGKYDKLVSIEMIEAVGHSYLSGFFEKCSSLLKDDGLCLIQAITIPDQRYDFYRQETDFIKRYIFPGGHLPSLGVIQKCLGQNTNMQLTDLEDIGYDYALTIREWNKRLQSNLCQLKALGYDDNFIRMWEFYFCYCEAGFLEKSISTVQLTFMKPQAAYKLA
jgi:cyclopropane-fatty-acyl-phospholipid synthase